MKQQNNRNSRKYWILAAAGWFTTMTLLLICPYIKTLYTAPLPGGADASLFIWFMELIAQKISTVSLNLHIDYIFDPLGINLLWNTSIIFCSIILTPITLLTNPTFSYNICILLGFILSALSTFLLCRKITGKWWLSILAGTIYGFSPYMISHSDAGHLNLTTSFIPPLLAVVIINMITRALQKDSGLDWKNAIYLGILVLIQMLTGEEILMSLAIITSITLGVAAIIWRKEISFIFITRLLYSFIIASVIAIILCSPFLYAQLTSTEQPDGLIQPLNTYVTDLANLVVPTHIQLIAPKWTQSIAAKFSGNPAEWNAYLSIPFIILLISQAITTRKKRFSLFCCYMIIIPLILSLGPFLHIGGVITRIPMPWLLFERLPLLNHLLPCRLTMYSYLAIAIFLPYSMQQSWKSQSKIYKTITLLLLSLSMLFLFPKFHFSRKTSYNIPYFFNNPKLYKANIPKGSLVITVPVATGDVRAMQWQTASHMQFRLVGGYGIGRNGFFVPPSAFLQWLCSTQVNGTPPPSTEVSQEQILSDIKDRIINFIIVEADKQYLPVKNNLTTLLGPPNIADGGVWIWKIDHGN